MHLCFSGKAGLQNHGGLFVIFIEEIIHKLVIMKVLLFIISGSVIGYSTCNKSQYENTSAGITPAMTMKGKIWEVDELLHNVSGKNSHYIRGVKNSTDVNYDKMSFTFEEDGSGTHTDQYGVTHKTSWKFDKQNDKTMHLTVHLNVDLDFTWRMVEVNANSIYATTAIYNKRGNDILESFRLKPVK